MNRLLAKKPSTKSIRLLSTPTPKFEIYSALLSKFDILLAWKTDTSRWVSSDVSKVVNAGGVLVSHCVFFGRTCAHAYGSRFSYSCEGDFILVSTTVDLEENSRNGLIQWSIASSSILFFVIEQDVPTFENEIMYVLFGLELQNLKSLHIESHFEPEMSETEQETLKQKLLNLSQHVNMSIEVIFEPLPSSTISNYRYSTKIPLFKTISSQTMQKSATSKLFSFSNSFSGTIQRESYPLLLTNYVNYLNIQNDKPTLEDLYIGITITNHAQISHLQSLSENMLDVFKRNIEKLSAFERNMQAVQRQITSMKSEEIQSLTLEIEKLKQRVAPKPKKDFIENFKQACKRTVYRTSIDDSTQVDVLELFLNDKEKKEALGPQSFRRPHPAIVEIDMETILNQIKSLPTFTTITYMDNGKYEGQFREDMRNGIGIYYYASGNKYIGEWKDNHRNGIGTQIFVDGNKYVGSWKKDMRDGYGTCWFADGGIYTGDFAENKRKGYGHYTYPSGNQYSGEWDGVRTGKGTYHYAATNDLYEGEWKDDVRSGHGRFQKHDGTLYEGEWKFGMEHGMGKITSPDKTTFLGTFAGGKKNGKGRIEFLSARGGEDFSLMEGEWLDDVLEGEALIVLRSGDVLRVIFTNGVIATILERRNCAFKSTLLEDFEKSNQEFMLGDQKFNAFCDIDIS